MFEVACQICPATPSGTLIPHLRGHGLDVPAYLGKFPTAPVLSRRALYSLPAPREGRRAAPGPENLSVNIAGVSFPVNLDVPESACLAMPEDYRVPKHGLLATDVQQAAIAIQNLRSIYVWGDSGAGKDAFFHAISWLTRMPGLMKSINPSADIESWFYSRGFGKKGTYWKEGAVLKAMRDGYLTASGRRVPYMVLFTDFDRANKEQAEYLRLLADSIQGRIEGPGGRVYPVLPGTRIVATANTAGGGDEKDRMTSAQPIDGSIMNRFQRKFEFHLLHWDDESLIVASKHPAILQAVPGLLPVVGKMTTALRLAISNEQLHGEFSHRDLCTILGNAEDLLRFKGSSSKADVKFAAGAWLSGLPDKENRKFARTVIDREIGT